MTRQLLTILLLLTSSACQAQSITLTRDGKPVKPTFSLSADPVEASDQFRVIIAGLLPEIKQTDTLVCSGTIDFGRYYVINLPSCNYASDPKNPAKWLAHHMIDATTVDGVQTKPSSTPGIMLGKYAKFDGFSFGGDCWNRSEDGGLLGFSLPEESYAEFVNCDIDASQGHDWAIYAWSNHKRTVVIQGGSLRFCRFGVALAASGAAAQQTVILDGVKLIGDANGSTSYGESSGGDVNSGGVLTAVLNRSGLTAIRDCTVEAIGLTKPYNSKWGCPRIAALATNQYYSSSGATSFIIERCKVNITPGISQAWYDVDVRSNGKLSVQYNDQAIKAAQVAGDKLLVEARGGSGEGGELKVWKP